MKMSSLRSLPKDDPKGDNVEVFMHSLANKLKIALELFVIPLLHCRCGFRMATIVSLNCGRSSSILSTIYGEEHRCLKAFMEINQNLKSVKAVMKLKFLA